MLDWIQETHGLQATGVPAVLVSVAGVRGSAPREVGAKMLVTATDTRGTIGGGELEYQCNRIAADILRAGGAGRLRRFPLGSNCGQCCGGVVDILFEPLASMKVINALHKAWSKRQRCLLLTVVDTGMQPRKALLDANGCWHGDAYACANDMDIDDCLHDDVVAHRLDTPGRNQAFALLEPVAPSTFSIAVFGAGHVGSAVVAVLAGLDCELRWIDSRRAVFPDRLPGNVLRIESADPAREVSALPANTFSVVMTHSHALDLAIVASILRRPELPWCGLIGSATKRRRFQSRLRAYGIGNEERQRLTCPIGIDGVSGKQPQEIAIAVAAQLLRLREQQNVQTARDSSSLSLVRL